MLCSKSTCITNVAEVVQFDLVNVAVIVLDFEMPALCGFRNTTRLEVVPTPPVHLDPFANYLAKLKTYNCERYTVARVRLEVVNADPGGLVEIPGNLHNIKSRHIFEA